MFTTCPECYYPQGSTMCLSQHAPGEAVKDDGSDDGVLGPCGCTDYHMADCNVGGAWLAPTYEEEGGF